MYNHTLYCQRELTGAVTESRGSFSEQTDYSEVAESWGIFFSIAPNFYNVIYNAEHAFCFLADYFPKFRQTN